MNPVSTSISIIKSLIVSLCVLSSQIAYTQGCCAGGGGSPIAGGVSQGVLLKKQFEFSTNYQHVFSNRFLGVDPAIPELLESYNSNYLYTRLSYGITEDLTMSVAGGYFIDKTQYGADYIDTISSTGFGDLIIFPRYDIWKNTSGKGIWEATIGLGLKIPVGSYNDSLILFQNETTTLYQKKPPGIQPTTGSNDFIFYGFLLHEFPRPQLKVFTTFQYILKGWNPNGEKFGDYATVSLYGSRMLGENFNITLSGKYEFIGKLERAADLPLANFDEESFGSTKLFIVPQLSYTFFHRLTLYGMYELPVYQHVNGGQVASFIDATAGLSYRFFIYDDKKAGK